MLDLHFGPATTEGDVEDDLPLFPDLLGNIVAAAVMVQLVEEIARRTGEDVFTPDGRRRYGKHSWRSTGAVFLSLFLDIAKIMMLARWASAIVTHYTRLAPLKTITNDFKAAVARRHGGVTEPKPRMDRPVQKLTKQLEQYDRELEELRLAIKGMETSKRPVEYARNLRAGVLHKVLVAIGEDHPPKAYCGWKYSKYTYSLQGEAPDDSDEICGDCFPRLKAMRV